MGDPLTLLQQYNVSKKEIQETQNEIVFGDLAFSKKAKTRYVKYGTGKDGAPKEYYTLETLLFFLKHVGLRHPVYFKRAVEADVPIVGLPDKKELLSYLNGGDKTYDSIDRAVPSEVPLRRVTEPDPEPIIKKPRIEDVEKMQARLKSMLGTTGHQGAGGERLGIIHDLSQDLTAEKIQEIKNKHRTRKRGMIKQTDDEAAGAGGRAWGLDSDLDVARDILTKERQWKTRSSCLESQAKNFSKTIYPLLMSIKAREDGKLSKTNSAGEPTKTSNRSAEPTAYNRYAQEALMKEETGEFKIDTEGTFHGVTLKSITEGAQPRQQVPGPGGASGSSNSGRPGNASIPASISSSGTPGKPQKRTSRTPIIVIPAAFTSLITMYNARDFLQDLTFIPTEVKKAAGMRRDNQVLVQRTKEGGLTVPYQVTDNPLKLSPEEWERVVAVFVHGPTWQFKKWPWNGNPVEIFVKLCAFHLRYDDQKMDPNVKNWNVNLLQVSQNRRHLDRQSALRFWDVLEKYMFKHKPNLRS